MSAKVIFLIETLSNGGAERVVSNLSINLDESIEREIILSGADAKVEYEYKGNIKYLDRSKLDNPLSKLVALFKRTRKLRQLKRDNPDTPIISFLEYPNLLNMVSGRTDNSIVSVRNFMSIKHNNGIKAFFWNLTIKRLYRKAREIIVVSTQMKKDLVDNYKLPQGKIKVIYNSYPINEIEQLTKEELSKQEQILFNKPTIVTVGRLNRQKGQKHLINAFKIIKNSIPQAQLVFLGEGNLEEQLKEQVKRLKVESSVHFMGFQENPFKYVAKSKVFALTSYYEGFPNALAEAMACGIPVLSTDCMSGPKEILAPFEKGNTIKYDHLNDRYGFLVPNITNENQQKVEFKIANNIITLLNNDQIYGEMCQKSQQRIKDFDIQSVIKEWESVIRNCKQRT